MARMIPIETFIPLVTVHASEAPHPVVEQQIRLAAIEFCERTRCWRHVVRREIGCPASPIRIIPPYATIWEFEFAYFNDAQLTPTQLTDIDFEPTETEAFSAPPTHISQMEPGQVLLFPRSSEPGLLYMSMFLKPIGSDDWDGGTYDIGEDDDLNMLPDFMLVQHAETIARGALARILAIPGQRYTDMARAGAYAADFHERMDTRFHSNLRGQQRAPARSKPHNF